ncbi:MAG: glycosyltransferase family 2 protein [Bacteroidales bacterium]|nr:glycosyltransferase family 2 protein [Bacteroidales bacterium]
MVSIIVPNYNHAAFLSERMNSILSQRYVDYEIILLDDCSSDASLSVMESYKDDPHVKAIVANEQNSGSPYLQWKKGMELASGEFIWIAESDDSCTPDLLETAMQAFTACKETVLWFCASRRTNAKGRSTGLHPNQKGEVAFRMNGRKFVQAKMRNKNMVVNASSAVFRRKEALQVQNGWEQMSGYGDYMFWIGLASFGKVEYCAQEMNFFRFHGSNRTAKMLASAKGINETTITDRFLFANGIISSRELFWRDVNSLYRIKYKMSRLPGTEEAEARINPGHMMKLAVKLKRLWRRASGKD